MHTMVDPSQWSELQGWRYFSEFSPEEIADMVEKRIISQPLEGQPPLMPAGIKLPEAPGLQMQSAMRSLCAAISHLDYSFHANRITMEAKTMLGYSDTPSREENIKKLREKEAELWENHPMKPTQIIATTVSPRNIRSMKSLEAAGFVRSEKGTIAGTSDIEDYVYVLDWEKLDKLMKNQALEEMKPRFIPQDAPVENTTFLASD